MYWSCADIHFSSELLLLISTVGSLVPLQVNQIGSVTESINAVKLAKKNGWGVMTSHRSGTHAMTLYLYGSVFIVLRPILLLHMS